MGMDLNWFRKVYKKSMIRSALPDRIIPRLNIFLKAFKDFTFSLAPFGGTLPSYLFISFVALFAGTLSSYLRGTLPSYFVALLLSATAVQRNITSFLNNEGSAESGSSEPLKEKEGTGVALYLRVSTDRQAEKGFSLKDQEERLRAEAERLKATRIYPIVDAGESGTDFNRKGLNEILELARGNNIQYVLVTSLDRIGRDLIESLDYTRKLRDFGVKIIAAGTEADIATEEGLMNSTIQFLSAELENRRRTKSSIAGRIQSFKSRRWGSPVPKGYHKRKDGWIEKEPSWDPLIKDVFDSFLRVGNYRAVRDIINKRYRDFLTNPVTRHQIKQILHDPTYMGKPRYAGKVTVEDSGLAYVNPETFEKVQELANRIRRRYSHKKKDALQDLVRKYGLDVLEFIPDTAVLCPDCKGVMVKNGTISIGEWTAHNYLCRKCGKQRKVPTKNQIRRIQEWAPNTSLGSTTSLSSPLSKNPTKHEEDNK